jgi:hypothetical protein
MASVDSPPSLRTVLPLYEQFSTLRLAPSLVSMSVRSGMAEGCFSGEAFCLGKRFAVEHRRRIDTKKLKC